MILFCTGNLGGKKGLCRKKKCLLISLSQHFTILHLNSFKNDLGMPKMPACI